MEEHSNRYIQSMEEGELISACAKGNAFAQRQLYERYAGKMMSVCARYADNRDTAHDLLQDGFIKLFGKIGSYKGEGAFEGWMRKLFVNTALEYLRREKEPAVEYDENIIATQTSDYSVVEKISAEELMKKIAMLPRGFRTVFNLYAIEGYSHQEIAVLLNITEGTSRSQYVRARNSLQEMIKGGK